MLYCKARGNSIARAGMVNCARKCGDETTGRKAGERRAKGQDARRCPEAVVAGAPIAPFWKRKSLKDMTNSEWEQLCDGCGRCCLEKLQEEDSETVHCTDIACRLFDPATCRCTDYARRARRVSGCVQLSPRNIAELHWMPVSCAYRLLTRGATFTGGIRWFRAARKPSRRPAFRCAGA